MMISCIAAVKFNVVTANLTKGLDSATAPDMSVSEGACQHLVNVDPTVEETIAIVKRECVREGVPGGARRIKPVVMSRMSRGGKTTVLLNLFERLKDLDTYLPIFISFNSNTQFRHRADETHEHAILRRIAVQFMTTQTDDFNINIDSKVLLEYIAEQSVDKKVVLIIDELNRLSTNIDEAAANLLRSEFLDMKNRYLVISTHVPLDLEATHNSATVIGKRSSSEYPASDRGTYVVHMPVSTNLADLRQMSPDCRALTPFEAVFYGFIPSLIYSIKGGQLNTMERVAHFRSRSNQPDISVESFLDMVLSGVGTIQLSSFLGFGTAVADGKIQFPLCYIHAILVIWFGQNYFMRLYKSIEIYGSTVGTGLDWETVVQYAVMMRCVLACECEQYNGPFDILPPRKKPKFLYIEVPGEIRTIEDMIDYVKSRVCHHNYPILALVKPMFASFPMFDGFVWYHQPHEDLEIAPMEMKIGFQCKLGNEGASQLIPDYIAKGVLVRGKPSGTSFQKDKWEYMNAEEIDELVGFSLKPLIPVHWPAYSE